VSLKFFEICRLDYKDRMQETDMDLNSGLGRGLGKADEDNKT